MEIKRTIDDVIATEQEAELLIKEAQDYAQALRQKTDDEIDELTKKVEAQARQEAKNIIDEAKLAAQAQAQEIILNGQKEAQAEKEKAEANVDEVSDYIIHKLKVNYGNN